jgi:hypothetical protein
MKETILNLFLFAEDNVITELGAVDHCIDGTDQKKIFFLQCQVTNDFGKSKRFAIPSRFSRSDLHDHSAGLPQEKYNAMMRYGSHLELFEEIFQSFSLSDEPLVVITPVVNGKVVIDAVTGLEPLKLSEFQNSKITGPGIMTDYLEAYTTSAGFDIPRLINDDYFLSIKLLYNNKHYISSAKLLFSCIDTISYLEFGDISGNFQKWLDSYADLSSVGVNSAELWEMRNSLLHMTNLDSRKVLLSKIRRLVFYIGDLPEGLPTEDEQAKYFSLTKLIQAVMNALQQWFMALDQDRSKIEDFISRYDRILSDTRYAVLSHGA